MTITGKKLQEFPSLLLKWNKEKNSRKMPWKGEKDPYKIWLSEIILQQTRVEQGLAYYNNFIKTFPDIHKLAKSPEQKVFKLWEGLGYYSRCRNLIASAKFIANDLKGKFPESYDDIKNLKGVGPYTAAAISSFAFNLPHAVVDGNVYRVLARVFGIPTPIDSNEGKKKFSELAEKLLDTKQPGLYNQAIMDFGATVCKPTPNCVECPLEKICYAYSKKKIDTLPVKEKKLTIKKRWFYYFIIEYRGKVAIRKRVDKDIWQDLHEFPMLETIKHQNVRTVLESAEKKILPAGVYDLEATSGIQKQQLSHQLIEAVFLQVTYREKMNARKNDWKWIPKSQLKKYSFPRLINSIIETAL